MLRSAPTQSSPPFAGEGLSHVRARVRDPLPQVTSHVLHPAHADQLPSTVANLTFLNHTHEL